MQRLSYLLMLAGILISFLGCTELPNEMEETGLSSPSFSHKGQVIAKRINQDYQSNLCHQDLCNLFSTLTTLPIQTITFEEESGYFYLRAYDGTANYYRNLDLDPNTGELYLMDGGKKCAGDDCNDCALKGAANCICDGVGNDASCKYSEIKL